MAKSPFASSGPPSLWQCYVRNLDWGVTPASLRAVATSTGNVAANEIKELRLCRSGQYFNGKLCSAFFGFQAQDGAARLSQSWSGKTISGICGQQHTLACKVVAPDGGDVAHPPARAMIFAQPGNMPETNRQRQGPPTHDDAGKSSSKVNKEKPKETQQQAEQGGTPSARLGSSPKGAAAAVPPVQPPATPQQTTAPLPPAPPAVPLQVPPAPLLHPTPLLPPPPPPPPPRPPPRPPSTTGNPGIPTAASSAVMMVPGCTLLRPPRPLTTRPSTTVAPGKGKSTAEGKEENNEKGGEVDDSTAEGGKKEPPKQGEEPEQPPIPEEAVHQQPADDGVEVTVQGEEEEQQQEEESDDDDDTIGRHLCGFDDGYYDGPLYVEGPTTSPSSPPPPLLEMKAELGEDTNTSPADGVLDSLASPVGVPPLPQDGDDDEGDETLRPWQRREKKRCRRSRRPVMRDLKSNQNRSYPKKEQNR